MGAIIQESVSGLKQQFVDVEGVDNLIRNVFNRLYSEDKSFSRSAGMVAGGVDLMGSNEQNMARILRRECYKVLNAVKKKMQLRAKASMANDPRKASQAVKVSRWKKQIGGSVSLYDRKKPTGRKAPIPPTKSGKPRQISERTRQVMEAWGSDRAFILRFIDLGTVNRYTGGRFKYRRGVKAGRVKNGGHVARRGRISARGFFRGADGVMKAEVGQMTATLENFIRSVGVKY